MLNPSTADAFSDDPTIRRCIKFSQKWGASRLDIVNLFSYRSTQPKSLYNIANPIGEENDDTIRNSIISSKKVIVAWGNHGTLHNRAQFISSEILKHYQDKIFSLKILNNGQPGHPLYIPYETELQQFIIQDEG